MWPGLKDLFPVTVDPRTISLKDLEERMLFAEALETVKCLDEGVIESVADANIGSIFGIGFPAWTGGVLQYIEGYPGGAAGFVARADEFRARYGDRFEVPQSLRDGAYALGATRSETIRQVVMRAALPGIVGGVLLAVSRAIGETMIVVMAAGLAANLTFNPLEAVTTVTVQIVTLLVGDQEFDSPKTLAAFALGLVLFLVTLALNVLALHIVRKYREQYE